MPACGERKRNEKGKFYLIRERKMRASKIHGDPPHILYLGSSNTVFDLFPSAVLGASECQGTLSHKSTLLLRISLSIPV
jgi:hypothetical protein